MTTYHSAQEPQGENYTVTDIEVIRDAWGERREGEIVGSYETLNQARENAQQGGFLNGGFNVSDNSYIQAIKQANGNVSAAAKLLGVSRSTLNRYMNNHPTVADVLEQLREASTPEYELLLQDVSSDDWQWQTDKMLADSLGIQHAQVRRFRLKNDKPPCQYKSLEERTIRGLRALSRRHTPSMTASECARLLDCTIDYFRSLAIKYSIPYKKVDQRHDPKVHIPVWRELKNDGTDTLKDLTSKGVSKIHNKRYLEIQLAKHGTLKAVAVAEGLNHHQVKQAAQKFGIALRPRIPEEVKTVLAYSPKPVKTLAEKYGVSSRQIYNIKSQMKKPTAFVFNVTKLSSVDKQVLVALVNQASAPELSVGLDLPYSQVWYTLRKLAKLNLAKAIHWEATPGKGVLRGYWEGTPTGLATAFELIEMEASWA